MDLLFPADFLSKVKIADTNSTKQIERVIFNSYVVMSMMEKRVKYEINFCSQSLKIMQTS